MRAAALGVCNGHARGQRAGTGATPKEDNHLQHVIAQNVQLFASAAQPRVQCANLPPHALSVPRVPHVPFAPVQLSKLNCVSSSAQQAKLPSVPRAPATWAWAHACCVGVGGCCVAARAESFRDTRTPRDTETLQRHRDNSETQRHFRDTETLQRHKDTQRHRDTECNARRRRSRGLAGAAGNSANVSPSAHEQPGDSLWPPATTPSTSGIPGARVLNARCHSKRQLHTLELQGGHHLLNDRVRLARRRLQLQPLDLRRAVLQRLLRRG